MSDDLMTLTREKLIQIIQDQEEQITELRLNNNNYRVALKTQKMTNQALRKQLREAKGKA